MLGASLNLSGLQSVFSDVRKRADNWRKPLTESGPPVVKEFKRRWDSHGPGWAPNTHGSPDLVKSGRLRDSFLVRGAEGNLWRVSNREGTWGSDLTYAQLIHAGGPMLLRNGSTANLPPRPLVAEPSYLLQTDLGHIARAHFTNLAGSK